MINKMLQDMHIKVEVTKQLKLQVRATVSIFIVAAYD